MTNVDTSVLLVRHRAGAGEKEIEEFHGGQVRTNPLTPALSPNGGEGVKRFKHLRWSAVKLSPGQEKRIRDNYVNSKLFDRVEFNQLYRPTVIPNDPLYPSLWGLAKIGASNAWDRTSSNDVIVAVVDSGIDYNHPDLRDNLWTGPQGEHGYTAVSGVISAGGLDDHLHGTHVAGIIGARGNNGLGVVGVNWRVRLLSGKFIGATGFGSTEDAVLIMEKMVDLKLAGHNIRVANHSWGGGAPSQALEDGFLLMQQAGIVNVCAAGNSSTDSDIEPFYPASYPNESIISVLASDANDDKAGFSNWGDVSTDLFAPGTVILSTKLGGDYLSLNGTSMAAPHVAGVCAALFGINPNMSYKQCKDVLLYPDSLDHVSFTHNSTFGGRLNMQKAVNSPLIFAAPNNNSPVLTILGTNLADIPPGQSATMKATATDPDGDALHYSYSLRSKYVYDYWLVSEAIGTMLRSESGQTNQATVFNENYIAADLDFEALFAVTDGRGGSDLKKGDFFVRRDDTLVKQPTATVSLRTDPALAYPILSVASADGYAWYSYTSLRAGNPKGQTCCFPMNSETPVYGGLVPGPNVFRAQVMDRFGNLGNSQRLVVDVGNTGKYVPEAKVKVNTTRGPRPLNVVADMSESDPGNAHGLLYKASAWRQGGEFIDGNNPVRTFTLDRLGINPIEFEVYDPTNQISDVLVMMFTVLPPAPVQTNPPPVSLVAPQDLSAKLGTGGVILLSWSDTGTGEDRWEVDTKFKSGPLSGFRQVTLNADTRSYSLVGQKKTSYEFRVRCCKGEQCSGDSNTAMVRAK